MQYAFLEKLAENGHLTEADKDRIYNTCSEVMSKVAIKIRNPFVEKMPTWGEAFGELGKNLITRVAPAAIAVGGGLYTAKKIGDYSATTGDIKKLLKVRSDLLKLPDFEGYQDKASARFDEIVKISPKAATMPQLATKLVQDRLHSGFTLDELQRLAQIQASYSPNSGDADAVVRRLTKKGSSLSSEDQGRIAANIVALIAEAGQYKTAMLPWKKTPFEKARNVAKQVLTTGAIVSGFGALVGLGAGTVNQGMSHLKQKNREEKLRNSFLEAMKRSDPSKEPLHANKDKAMQAFQTLTHFAPNVAADPEAARAFMLNLISMDQGVQVGAIKDLSEIEKNLKATKSKQPFLEGLQVGAEFTGLPSALGKVTGGLMNPVMEHGSQEIAYNLGY